MVVPVTGARCLKYGAIFTGLFTLITVSALILKELSFYSTNMITGISINETSGRYDQSFHALIEANHVNRTMPVTIERLTGLETRD